MQTQSDKLDERYVDLGLQLTNDMLTQVCDPFDFENAPYEPINLSNNLTLLREKYRGLGLAANQVGLNLRVISVKGIDSCLFNPKIVDFNPVTIQMEEGCLSFPGMVVKIKRPIALRLRYADATGAVQTKTFNGWAARSIQHEVDHLDGILFYNRANKFHRDQALNQWNRSIRHQRRG